MQLNIYLCTISSTSFGLTRPSSGAMDVIIYLHIQHMVSLVWLGVGLEECVCWWRVAVQNATSTHNYTKETIFCICKEIITSIAPEDRRVSPKHVELKVHK